MEIFIKSVENEVQTLTVSSLPKEIVRLSGKTTITFVATMDNGEVVTASFTTETENGE